MVSARVASIVVLLFVVGCGSGGSGTDGDADVDGDVDADSDIDGDGDGDEDVCSGDDECDDDDPCNGAERCVDGSCEEGTPLTCDDSVACTEDICDPDEGRCVHHPDHDQCDDDELCTSAGCLPGQPCVEDSDCVDDTFCNGNEHCDPEFGCQAGSEPDCDDGVDCTADTCDLTRDDCLHAPVDEVCTDETFCNGAELCHVTEGCGPGEAPDCDDELDCTDDECSIELDVCVNTSVDRDGDGELAEACGGSDCDDTTETIAEGAEEVCDGVDNDCDDEVDEDVADCCTPEEERACGTEVGLCEFGTQTCSDDREWMGCEGGVTAVDEVCDGVDNDCDDETDEGLGTTTCGVGPCLHTVDNCVDGEEQVCDPFDGAIEEVCDGENNDCDDETDEGLGTTTCGLGLCEHTIDNCEGGEEQECDPLEGAIPEVCDGNDNDCDGTPDDDDEVARVGCAEGTDCCGGGCVDVLENPEHCGDCETTCTDDELCLAGDCVPARGCAEGPRRGFLDLDLWPSIAACGEPLIYPDAVAAAPEVCAPGWAMCTPADINAIGGDAPPATSGWVRYTDATTTWWAQYTNTTCAGGGSIFANLRGTGGCTPGGRFPEGWRLFLSAGTWGSSHRTNIGCIRHVGHACGYVGPGTVDAARMHVLCCAP